ncbi:gliding motility-associated C-terminal domain-containing protein, partial [Sphingobacterium tabacisoli]
KTVTPSVLDNDKLNGKPVIPSEVEIKVEKPADPRNPGEPVPTLDPNTGKVTINPETPAGEYKIEYKICEVLNPTNCDNAVITITVVAPEIKAVDDEYGPYNGKDGGETASVFENDLLNKVKLNPNDIELTAGVPVNGAGEEIRGLIMNKNGKIKVEKETAAGKYYYPYKITEKVNPDNFDDAVAIVTVIAAPIKANDDRYQINGKNGGTTPTVIENDKLNGKAIDPKEIELKIGKPTDLEGKSTTVVTMNPDGTITVAPNTPKGTYLYPYTICEVLNPTNCSSAVAKIEILPAPIVATDDSYKVEWTRESVTTASVLLNDKYNSKPVNLDEVTLLPGAPSHPGLSMNPDGTITIAPSTRPGTYTYPYTICEILNPTNCSTAVATIVIEASNVFIPNTFTPNGDGVNDKFEIVGVENFDNVSVTIVNRWGNEVYRNDSYKNEWNGSGLNEGTYYYIITLRKGTTETVHKGWVLIKTR